MREAGLVECELDMVNHYPAYLSFLLTPFRVGVVYERSTSKPALRWLRGAILCAYEKAATSQEADTGRRQSEGSVERHGLNATTDCRSPTLFTVSVPICFAAGRRNLLWTVVAFATADPYVVVNRVLVARASLLRSLTLAGVIVFSRDWLNRIACREVFADNALWGWFTITSVVSASTPLFAHHSHETWQRWMVVSKILLMTVTIGIIETFGQLRILVLVIAGCFGLFILKALPFVVMTRGAYRIYGPPQSMIAE